MQHREIYPGIFVLEGKARPTLIERVEAFFGTALGTAIGLGIFGILYVIAGTMDYAALVGR
jgi:hypothetical protein